LIQRKMSQPLESQLLRRNKWCIRKKVNTIGLL